MNSYIYIDGWKENIGFSSAHVIPEYEKCGRLHGHSYAVHTKIFGKSDEKGIIMDFSILKKNLREIVNRLDHKVIIPKKSNVVKIEKQNDSVELISLGKKYVFPLEDCILLPIASTSAETLAEYILKQLLKNLCLTDRIYQVEVGVDEGFGQGAKVSKKM